MKPICYKGEWFDSLKALHEKHAANGVSYASFYGRHKAGWSLKDALATPHHKREMRTFDVDGIIYPTLVELANAAGITYLAAVKRCHRGWSDGEIFYGRQKPERPAKARVARGIPVVVAGVQYQNIGHAHSCIRPSLTLNAVKARLRYGWSYEQAFGLETKIDGRALLRERSRSPRTKQQYVAFGKTYRSVASLARAHTMDQHLVYNRLRKGWTAERAVSEPATQTVEVNGHIYRSAMNAWKEIGETSFFVFNARKQAGHDLETCLGLKPLRDESQIVNGVTYPSLAKVAAAFRIKESVLESRMTRMSLEEAVTYNPSNGRYTLKRFKEDPVLAESLGYLYFIEITFPSGALHKVGITQRRVESRFAATPNFRTIAVVTGSLCELFLIEQSIIKKFRANLFRGEDEFEGRTETFLLTTQEEKAILSEIEAKSASLKIRPRQDLR